MATKQALIESIKLHLSNKLPELKRTTKTPINRGGCGIFAKLLSKKLNELNIPHTIVFTDPNTSVHYTINEYDNGNKLDLFGAVPQHVLVKVDNDYIDCDGVVNYKAQSNVGEISFESLQDLIKKGDWNPAFKRRFTSAISRKLNAIFAEL